MKTQRKILLTLALSLILVSGTTAHQRGWTRADIWYACWSSNHADWQRQIHYPDPIHLTVRNRSFQDWELCVFDNLCPFTLFNGLLRHNFSIYLTACADQRGRGSITLMNSQGDMWFYPHTGDRIITLER